MIKRICDLCGSSNDSVQNYLTPYYKKTYIMNNGVKLATIKSGLGKRDIDLCENCAETVADFIESMDKENV